MQLQYVSGDIFTSSAQVLVNPVNCEGGKGLALEFKRQWPSMVVSYLGQVNVG
ncbi:MAG: hypothetical protein NVS9B9_28970 [Ktedonobacteraceae bacterium]